MPTVSAGTTSSITLAQDQVVLFTLDPSEAASYSVTRSGATVAGGLVTGTRSLGPFDAGDVMTITANRGAVDYDLSVYIDPPPLNGSELQALQALTGDDKTLLLGANAGTSSAWVPYIAGMRLAWQLDSGTISTTFSIDISADGVTSLGQAYTGVWASSTVAEISPPLYLSNPLARFIRFNVLSGGPLSVDRSV